MSRITGGKTAFDRVLLDRFATACLTLNGFNQGTATRRYIKIFSEDFYKDGTPDTVRLHLYEQEGLINPATLVAARAVPDLLNLAFYTPVVPPSPCSDKGGRLGLMPRHEWVIASAAPEGLAAAGLLFPATRRAAATATALMFAGFTAGHVSALRRAFGPDGTRQARRVHSVRLPLQLPLVAWAWSARKR